jgi:hypothetical protein
MPSIVLDIYTSGVTGNALPVLKIKDVMLNSYQELTKCQQN